MDYDVVIEAQAQEDLENAYLWLYQQIGARALKWFYSIEEALLSLDRFPKRCGLAPENAFFKEEIRQRLFGRKHRYRILFTIKSNQVHVLHIRHASQDILTKNKTD